MKKFPSLQRYDDDDDDDDDDCYCGMVDRRTFFDKHLAEGLYLLQFRKCDDKNCFTIKTDPLPPPITAPVMHPDGQHYLAIDDVYGKVQTTKKDCPSLSVKVSQKSTT